MTKTVYTIHTDRANAELYVRAEMPADYADRLVAAMPAKGLVHLSCLDGLVNNPPKRCGIRRADYAKGWAARASVMIAHRQGLAGEPEHAGVFVFKNGRADW